MNQPLKLKFSDMCIKVLPRVKSDHHPILAKLYTKDMDFKQHAVLSYSKQPGHHMQPFLPLCMTVGRETWI